MLLSCDFSPELAKQKGETLHVELGLGEKAVPMI